jgi:Pyridine nucleotide-disulphide oxidoreductase
VVARAAVFVRPGNRPHDDGVLAGLGCERNEAGFPLVDGTGLTSVRGVWAAGNVADPRAQVITSAGAGSRRTPTGPWQTWRRAPFLAVTDAGSAARILAGRRPLPQGR